MGYLRFDTTEELAVLRELYTHLRLYVNYFQPQMKLISKTRNGAKVSKKFDVAQTPYRRVLASPDVPPEANDALSKIYKDLNPAQQKRDLVDCQSRLLKISTLKPRKEVKPTYDRASAITYSRKNADIIREATGGV